MFAQSFLRGRHRIGAVSALGHARRVDPIGLPWHVIVLHHVFRHSRGAALLQSDTDVTVIRDYLGHASIATTSRSSRGS
ncbi:tyrosine-type recombinase/integrase [Mesorhizobium sp.]|uniref:tyrosine-type recombinase/integrase n=1 Tax=Mesorhizobium sp. TaxID=1871066 RepID=UPI00342E4571